MYIKYNSTKPADNSILLYFYFDEFRTNNFEIICFQQIKKASARELFFGTCPKSLISILLRQVRRVRMPASSSV